MTLVSLGSIKQHSLKLFFIFTFEIVPRNSFEQLLSRMAENPYAFSLTSGKLRLGVLNALDRSIDIVPTMLPFSTACFYFSVIFKAICLLWFLRNAVNNGKNLDSKKRFICLTTIFSNILDA